MNTNQSMSVVALAAALGLNVAGTGVQAQGTGAGRSQLALADLSRRQHVPDEVLVQYRAGVSEDAKSAALARAGGRFEDFLVNGSWRKDGKGDLELVKIPAGLTIAAAVRMLEADPNVEFVEPNWVYHHHAVSNDTYFINGNLWGMYGSSTSPANQFGCGAAVPWAANKLGSSSVYVAIIDEGYMFNHVDLAANAWLNPYEIAGNGRDDDGNGYVDDMRGWDFDGNNNTVFDGAGDDHGTHVAGTIGGVGGNGNGVAGVCWNVKLIGVKFLGSQGGTTANAVKAVDYVTDLKTRHGLNLVASNNSWGGGGYSQALADAITRAGNADILFVAAAGNGGSDGVGDNNDLVASYPASYSNENIISVAAIASNGTIARFSNFGPTSVDIGAPGSGIISTVPVASGKGRTATISSSYATYSGTSMATPHVSGACALYKSINPTATASQVKAAILGSATYTPSLNGRVVTNGRLNVSGF